jgi:zinc transport system ATP-binding protein
MSLTSALREPVVGAADVSVELGGLPVLRGITLSVGTGEAVAVLGANGSGKSTLIRALLGLTPFQRGSVELFGTPLRSFRHWSAVGYVPQRSPVALGNAKVAEVVASGRLALRRPFVPPSRADRAAVSDALEAVGLSDRAGDRLSFLSGGQQQRVLIARALAGQARLLVLDEPTAGVDLAHQAALTDALTERVADGTAVIVVLHEVGVLAALITRALVLTDGRIAHDGALGSLGRTHHDHDHDVAEVDWSWFGGAVER